MSCHAMRPSGCGFAVVFCLFVFFCSVVVEEASDEVFVRCGCWVMLMNDTTHTGIATMLCAISRSCHSWMVTTLPVESGNLLMTRAYT